MANSAFKDSLDIANRALDHLGMPHILTVDEDSQRNQVISGIYDKVRQFELRRNVWRFAKRKAVLRSILPTTRRLKPADWEATVTYLPGAVVKWTNGDLWVSFETENLNNEPGTSDVWEAYYNTISVSKYDSAIAYYASELVYKTTNLAGSFIVYISLVNDNAEVPDTTTAWAATTEYGVDDLAYSGGFQWRSVIAVNIANTPAVAPSDWASDTTYAATNKATATDGYIYASVGNGNIGHDPVLDDGTYWTRGLPYAWSRIPVMQASSSNWLPVYSDLKGMGFDYLAMSIPANSNGDRNVFLLPYGYLREARINPRRTVMADDHEVYGDFLLSNDDDTILEAFVADINKVTRFDTMFCEMLALRTAAEACEALTQSTDKLRNVISMYKQFATEARQVNAIENGPEEPDEDEFITIRM